MEKQKGTECQILYIHDDIAKKVRDTLPPEEILYDLGDFFKVMGDTTRMKIMHALLISDMCVCDLAAVLGMTHSAVSHQLKVLRQANLVKFRKEGKSVFYSLSDDHVKMMIDLGLQHIQEERELP